MNRYEYEKAVYESGLNRTCKQILVYFAFRKNWNHDTKVWSSAVNIGKAIDVSSRTVEIWIQKVREQGWLVDTGERRASRMGRPCVVYDLAIPDLPEVTSVMSQDEIDSEEDLPVTTSVMSEEWTTEREVLTRSSFGKVADLPEMNADLPEMVADLPVITSDEQGINKIEEDLKEEQDTPASPVDNSKEFSIREDEVFDSSTLSNQELEAKPSMAPEEPVLLKKRINNYYELRNEFIKIRVLTKLPKEVADEAESIVLDPDWKPEVSRPSIRINDAIAKAWTDHEAKGGN